MKAVILAGGRGERLRPLTAETPKPMVPLLGAPLLEHSLRHLRRWNITKAALTLHYLGETIEDRFGDGSELGMELCCFWEKEPLGTAGAVRACRPFWAGEETVLVLSGDALWDLDLGSALDFHRRQRCAATLLLHHSAHPLEYGLVQTSADGTITGFVEKPGWGQVFTDQVNTGIYLLDRSALERIPGEGPCDFAKDLFPALLAEGKRLCGYAPDGYWRDIGDCDAYRQAVRDALDGRVRLELGQERKKGIWCASPVPESAKLMAPCYIGEKVSVGERTVIGPYTVLERGSRMERCAEAQESMILGAALEAGARANGAILCAGAHAGRGAVLNRGTVLGPRAAAASNAILRAGSRLWPDVATVPGEQVSGTLTGPGAGRLCFGEGAVLSGTAGQDITAELLLHLGELLGEEERLGLGFYGSSAAQSLLMAAAAGATAAGATVFLHDGTTPASAAWLAAEQQLPLSLFLRQTGEEVELFFFDRWGLPLCRARQRALEAGLLQGLHRRVSAHRMGQQRTVSGVDADYVRAAAERSGTGVVRRLTVHVPRQGRGNVLLREALTVLGMAVQPGTGPLTLCLTEDGGGLLGRDEDNRLISREQMLLITERLLLEGGESALVLPTQSPAASRTLAEAFRGHTLALDTDRETLAPRTAQQRSLWDGVFAACRILRRMGQTGERLSRLAGLVPECALRREELSLTTHRSTIMRRLTERFPEAEHTAEGLRVPLAGGSVFLAPRSRLSALRLCAEAASTEAAEELCGRMAEQVRRLEAAEE